MWVLWFEGTRGWAAPPAQVEARWNDDIGLRKTATPARVFESFVKEWQRFQSSFAIVVGCPSPKETHKIEELALRKGPGSGARDRDVQSATAGGCQNVDGPKTENGGAKTIETRMTP